jgi:hypothetical protein
MSGWRASRFGEILTTRTTCRFTWPLSWVLVVVLLCGLLIGCCASGPWQEI